MKHFKLDGRAVVPCEMWDWFTWFGHTELDARRVGLEEFAGHTVSSVFMGIDTNPGEHSDPRGVFETKVDLATGENAIVAKYNTWDAARAGHDAIVAALCALVNDSNLQAEALLARLRQAAK